MSNDKLEEILLSHLETYKYRIREHQEEYDSIDFKKRYEWRKDEPLKYGEQKLKEMAKKRKNED